MSDLIVWWVLPVLICFFLFIQLRHLEHSQTLQEFFKDVSNNDVEFIYLTIILWPIFIALMLFIFIVFLLVNIADKYNISPINFNWLFKEWGKKND